MVFWDLMDSMRKEHGLLLASTYKRYTSKPDDPANAKYKPYANIYMRMMVSLCSIGFAPGGGRACSPCRA